MLRYSFLIISVLFFSISLANAADLDVEDPYICQNTVRNYTEAFPTPKNNLEHLINAVRSHCLDQYQASTDTLTPVLTNPVELSTTQVTYAYILQSINLNNIGNDESCEAAKLSMAYASRAESDVLRIRAELNYFSFCNVYDDNTPHALKRLYELNKEATAINSANLQLAIHNQISYVYYLLDQNQLAAEELEVALAIGEQMQSDDYLVTLYNLIDAYLDAGELEMAASRISLYQAQLTEHSTVWEQWLLLYAQSYHALLSKEFDQVLELKRKLEDLGTTDSPVFKEKIAIIQGLACLETQRFDCAGKIISTNFSEPDFSEITRLTLLELLIKWYRHNQQFEDMSKVQQRYFEITQQKLFAQQQAAKVLGVAKLNNEVIRLNSEEATKQLAHQNEINRIFALALFVSLLMLFIFIVAYWRLKHKLQQPRVSKQL